ncbi:hypothetical protein EZV77_15910 [Burkholderia thailandensis]|nr:hypothetical protein AQ475_17620 [Burkholderia thailandensis]AVR29138.1 hypothetical protein A8H32_30800 [Burkholderia thailandensis]MDD1483846.1 hypothetical protein [Burkholderia thailandensis]MDD1490046.1 hypothetical protein [Burkholderia thailandensis]MDD1495973.1 hypothetical protein [Burkholderia thailandensis]
MIAARIAPNRAGVARYPVEPRLSSVRRSPLALAASAAQSARCFLVTSCRRGNGMTCCPIDAVSPPYTIRSVGSGACAAPGSMATDSGFRSHRRSFAPPH